MRSTSRVINQIHPKETATEHPKETYVPVSLRPPPVSPCPFVPVNYGLSAALISSYMMSTSAPPTPRRTLEKAPLKKAPAPSLE